MDSFPAFFPLASRTVVVAGQGAAAEAKVRLFEGSPARLVRLLGEEALSSHSYAGAILAFVASEDEAFADAAAAAARAAHVPVNVVDRPALCDFTTPAVIDRGAVVAAVGTGGASPMLATLLRHDIEARLPEGAGRVAVLLQTMQAEVRQAIPEPHARRAFLRAAIAGPAAAAAMAGDLAVAKAKLREALTAGAQPHGQVTFVPGAGPADHLTLAAVRRLAAADVLAPDPGVADEVLQLARRDAEHLAAGNLAPDRLAAFARRGLQVVRLTSGAPTAAELRALAELGVVTQVAPAAP